MNVPWLITGVTGLLGANAFQLLSDKREVFGLARSVPNFNPDKISSTNLLSQTIKNDLLEKLSGGVILHTAALSSIEECRKNPELAWQINVESSIWLSKIAQKIDAKYIFVSSDAVFDGTAGNYSEESETNPSSFYGKTKVVAEQEILSTNSESIIARVNFYGWSPNGRRSLAEFFVNNLSQNVPVLGFRDLTVTTSYVSSLISGLEKLVNTNQKGIFNVTSPEKITKYDLAISIARLFGFNAELITESTSQEQLTDQRGKDLSLNSNKFERATGSKLPSVEQDLLSFFEDRLSVRNRVKRLRSGD